MISFDYPAELVAQIHAKRMRDSFGGYDWGDPIQFWTPTGPAPVEEIRRWQGPCPRCGVPTGERKRALCRDCRAVEPACNWQAWEVAA